MITVLSLVPKPKLRSSVIRKNISKTLQINNQTSHYHKNRETIRSKIAIGIHPVNPHQLRQKCHLLERKVRIGGMSRRKSRNLRNSSRLRMTIWQRSVDFFRLSSAIGMRIRLVRMRMHLKFWILISLLSTSSCTPNKAQASEKNSINPQSQSHHHLNQMRLCKKRQTRTTDQSRPKK